MIFFLQNTPKTYLPNAQRKPLNTIRTKESQVAALTSLPSTGAARTAAGISTSAAALLSAVPRSPFPRPVLAPYRQGYAVRPEKAL